MSLPLPADFYEKMDESDPELRLFDKGGYYYQNHEYDGDLINQLPTETGLDQDRIASNPSDHHRSKFEKLLNGEQQALKAINLRPAIDEYRVLDHIEPKAGVDNTVLSNLQSSKQEFDDGRKQKRLDDIW